MFGEPLAIQMQSPSSVHLLTNVQKSPAFLPNPSFALLLFWGCQEAQLILTAEMTAGRHQDRFHICSPSIPQSAKWARTCTEQSSPVLRQELPERDSPTRTLEQSWYPPPKV